jgi:hypothetical protein
MSAEIIQLSAFTRPTRAASDKQTPATGDRMLTPRQRRREGKPELPPPATETAKNSRIRAARRDAWRAADRESTYWHARMKWCQALSSAQHWGVADSASLPSAEEENRFRLVDTWREAVVKQLLTPAADAAAIAWKRAQLAGGDFSYLPTKAERIERVIADDLAFLAAHPTRRSDGEAMVSKRAFNEAMRQRIRELAGSRNLPDDEIKAVLRLKHQEIGAFAIKHSVSLAWLLEGAGPIFKKYSQEHDQ